MVPSSFYHVLYAVAPPEKLQPGQNDIVREIKEGGRGAYNEVVGDQSSGPADSSGDHRKYHQVLPAPFVEMQVNPWKLLAAICFVLPCMWVFLIFGTIVDVALGDQALVTAPHWSRPPMTRLSLKPHELGTPLGGPNMAGDVPWLPENMAWHEEKRHADETSFHRRLAVTPARSFAELNDTVRELVKLMAGGQGTEPKALKAVWPAFFEPTLLTCGSKDVFAITPRGFGAAAVDEEGAIAEAFRLGGLVGAGPLVGASHSDIGLLVVSRGGGLFLCPGGRPTTEGIWACTPASGHGMPRALPLLDGTRLKSAATRTINGVLHSALVFEDAPETAALFAQDGDSWLPLGELRVPQGGAHGVSLAFVADGDLVIATGSGHVRRHSLLDGATVASAMHRVAQHSEVAWQAACGLEDGRVAHLALRKVAHGWQPVLAVADMTEGKAAFFA